MAKKSVSQLTKAEEIHNQDLVLLSQKGNNDKWISKQGTVEQLLSANLRKLVPPFVDYVVTEDVQISATNFNVNNILAEHEWEYGESEKKILS